MCFENIPIAERSFAVCLFKSSSCPGGCKHRGVLMALRARDQGDLQADFMLFVINLLSDCHVGLHH
jgi:hypothetical protein